MATMMAAALMATTAIVATARIVAAAGIAAAAISTAAAEQHGQALEGIRLTRQTQHTERKHNRSNSALHERGS
jgi:hypothetical protein